MKILLPKIESLTDKTVYQSSGTISTDIYLDLGNGVFFPDDRWSDFACIILNWWINDFLDQLENGGVKENCFMEGPCEFWTEIQNNEVHLKGVWRKVSSDEVRFRSIIQVEVYAQALMDAAKRLIDFFEKYPAIVDGEFEKIKAQYARIRSRFQNI